MFIRNAWDVAAWADEIGEDPARRGASATSLWCCSATDRTVSRRCSTCAATAARRCTWARWSRQGLQCGYHGLIFDRSGACVGVPGQSRSFWTARGPAASRWWSRMHSCGSGWAIRHGRIGIDNCILPGTTTRSTGRTGTRCIPIKAAAMLMVDNLMDLTHLGYVHTSTIGGNPSQHVEATMQTERTPSWLAVHPVDAEFGAAADVCEGGGVSGPHRSVPAVRIHRSGVGHAMDRCGRSGDVSRRRHQRAVHWLFRLFHGLTPETDSTCFYFWSAANGFRQEDPAATEQFFGQVAAAFMEDKIVVEGQQARLAELGEVWAGGHCDRCYAAAYAADGGAVDGGRCAAGNGGGVSAARA